jgi:hypothetical protein
LVGTQRKPLSFNDVTDVTDVLRMVLRIKLLISNDVTDVTDVPSASDKRWVTGERSRKQRQNEQDRHDWIVRFRTLPLAWARLARGGKRISGALPRPATGGNSVQLAKTRLFSREKYFFDQELRKSRNAREGDGSRVRSPTLFGGRLRKLRNLRSQMAPRIGGMLHHLAAFPGFFGNNFFD